MSNERPNILVVEQGLGDLTSPTRLLQHRFRVVTCPVESVALEYVSESRPAAVLMDAAVFYLEGAGMVERWRKASSGTRLLFVDMEGPWTLLLELAGPDTGDVAINPCAVDGIASAVEELLGHAPGEGEGEKEVRRDDSAVVAV